MNKDAKDFPEILTRFDKSPPPQIQPSDLPLLLTALINASLNKCKKNDAALYDKETAKIFLGDEKKLNTLLKTLSMVGTHNLKCPNANVQASTVIEPDLKHTPDDSPYVHSVSTHCERLTSGSGNAAYAGYFRFLSQEFKLGNQVTSVFRALAKGQAEVTSTLIQLGLSEEWLQLLEETASACWAMPGSNVEPDRFLKQVIWPGSDGKSDIVITPVMAFGLTRELHQRLNQRRLDEQRPQIITTKVTKVGGTQPINVGPYNAELGGLYRHLHADIPPIPGRKTRNYIRLSKHSKSLFDLVRHRKAVDISSLLRPGVEGMPARNKRQAHANAAALVIARIMKPVNSMRWQYLGISDSDKAALAGHLPEYEQAWLSASADRQQMEKIRERALLVLKTTPLRDGKRDNPLLDDSDNSALASALTKWLEAAL